MTTPEHENPRSPSSTPATPPSRSIPEPASARPRSSTAESSTAQSSARRSSPAPAEPAKDASPEEIEADIVRTRRELGETVEALAGKLDVKSQAREQVDEAKHRVTAGVHEARQQAQRYFEDAKSSVTDERGGLNRNGWIGVSVLASAVGLALAAVFWARRSDATDPRLRGRKRR